MNEVDFTAPMHLCTKEEAVFNVWGSPFIERETDYGIEVTVKVGMSDSATAIVTFEFYDTGDEDEKRYDVDMRIENNDSVSFIYYPEVTRLAVEAMVEAGYLTKFGTVVDNGF